MRIAVFHELDYGGARRAANELLKRLNKIFEVDLYYVDSKEDKEITKFSKKTFFYPFYPKIWKGNNWKIRLYKDTWELFRLYNLHLKISKDIKSRKYDYVFVHPSKFTQAPFLLRHLKNKCIYYCQEPLRIVYDEHLSNLSFVRFHKRLYEFLIRQIRKRIDLKNIKSASVVLANSNFSKSLIEKSYGIKAKVCYLGVDTNIFKPFDVKKTYDVLFIGNKDKGYDLLVGALQFFKKKPKIKTIFREKGQSMTDKELALTYNKSKILVALNQNEPFGLIPLEAMACGVPVIAIDKGGYKESIINNKTGFLVPPSTIDLYEKINDVINDNKLRDELAKSSRLHILKNWTWDKSIKMLEKIILNSKKI